MSKKRLFTIGCLLALILLGLLPGRAQALRANFSGDLQRLEEMGQFEEALFLRQSSMHMILAVHAAWAGVAYDPAGDRLYFQTRLDRRFWNLINSQKRPLTDLLAKAKLNPQQLEKLDERVRVYIEDHLAPEFDAMGNFYMGRIAWILERSGLFYDASFRRRLLGNYCLRVCEPYYAGVAQELEQAGDARRAAAYRAKAQWYRQQAQVELRRANGDRLLSQLPDGDTRQHRPKPQVIAFLKPALQSQDADVRLAAALALADLGEPVPLASLGDDPTLRQQLPVRPAGDLRPGIAPGIRASYYSDPDQTAPLARKALPAADIGFRGDERFPPKLKPYWEKPDIFPANASGQFLVRFEARLQIPEDGSYRFYLKTDGANRATMRLTTPTGQSTLISPRNDKQLLYSMQVGFPNGILSRIDFSQPIELKRGIVDLDIEYKGPEAKGKHGTPGLRLYWSSDNRVMELVPPSAFFHRL